MKLSLRLVFAKLVSICVIAWSPAYVSAQDFNFEDGVHYATLEIPIANKNKDSIEVTEGDTAKFTVTRTGFTEIASSVEFKTLKNQGTATAGTDYLVVDDILGFAPGETEKPIEVQTFKDDSKEFPEKYHNSVFIALHGSWNRTKKSGYKVILVKLDDSGNYLYQEDFITGWLSNENAWGRPAAPFVMSDGSLLVSDDKYNVIYKVQYEG